MTDYNKPVSTCSVLVSTRQTKIRRFKFFLKIITLTQTLNIHYGSHRTRSPFSKNRFEQLEI